ncbi:MAG: diguanylate cyclase [Clostridium sp.]|nr:diguanylate cyclase [Clostridium sp.]
MDYHNLSFDERISENIKNYSLQKLYDMERMTAYLAQLSSLCGAEYLLTDRHGERMARSGGYTGEIPDVAACPGMKIRVADRTVAHLYVQAQGSDEKAKERTERLFADTAALFSAYGQESYLHKELDEYSNELERRLEKEKYRMTHGDEEDLLTGTLNKSYFEKRRQTIDRSEVVPVAEICLNINDWKYAYDHFGNEESDRLIRVIAEMVKRNAKEDYVIGRTDGDVFTVLIPMAEPDEAKDYCERIARECMEFEDAKLSPSVAYGIVMKDNVEQNLDELYSDAEYEMFDLKYQIKNAPGYQERLQRACK